MPGRLGSSSQKGWTIEHLCNHPPASFAVIASLWFIYPRYKQQQIKPYGSTHPAGLPQWFAPRARSWQQRLISWSKLNDFLLCNRLPHPSPVYPRLFPFFVKGFPQAQPFFCSLECRFSKAPGGRRISWAVFGWGEPTSCDRIWVWKWDGHGWLWMAQILMTISNFHWEPEQVGAKVHSSVSSTMVNWQFCSWSWISCS